MIISPLLLIYFFLCVIFHQLKIFIIVIGTIILHEIGHIVAIKLFNGKIKKIKLSVIGGIMDVDIKREIYTKKYYLSNIIIAVGRNRNECFNYNYS